MTRNDELGVRIEQWFDEHREEYLRDLSELVAVMSVAGAPEDGKPYGAGPCNALMLATEKLLDAGFEVLNFENRVISADVGAGEAKLGMLAHLDTVGVAEGWDTYPFEAVYRDGLVYGRGVADDKGPALAALYAMRCAKELGIPLKSRCRLILGSAEETGCGDVTLYREKNPMPEYVFSPDSDYPIINIEKGRLVAEFSGAWAKEEGIPRIISFTGGDTVNIVPRKAEAELVGISMEEVCAGATGFAQKTGAEITVGETPDGTIRLTCIGKAAHAAHAEDGVNAQTALIALLAALPLKGEGHRVCEALTRLMPHGDTRGEAMGIAASDDISGALSLNFGVFTVSETGFFGNFDSRTPICSDDTDLASAVRKRFEGLGVTVTDVSVTKSHATPADSPLVKTLLGIYEGYTGLKGECLAVGGSTYVHEIEGGVAFGCVFPGKDPNMHGANEHADVEELLLSGKMFARAIAEICG